jgi:ribonuclease VapC
VIIDTSALIAILRAEADAHDCAIAIEKSSRRRLSAANFVETTLVIDAIRSPAAASTISSRRPRS